MLVGLSVNFLTEIAQRNSSKILETYYVWRRIGVNINVSKIPWSSCKINLLG